MKHIAVITGASSGMGREFVRQLDGKFDEIWGIALEKEGLLKVKEEIKTPFVVLDFDLTKDESFEKYTKMLSDEGVVIDWLVNASGFGKFGRHDEIDVESSANMIDLNCKALLKMTELSLPYMKEGGRISNIASVAGFQPIPYIATYGATKAFVISYSRALNQELRPRKIKITTICPFWTKTAFFDRATKTKAKEQVVSKYVVMYNPEKVVAKAIKDTQKGKELSIYGFVARSQVRLVNILPKKWVMDIWIKQQKLNKLYKTKDKSMVDDKNGNNR